MDLLWLIPALPLASAVVLMLLGARLPHSAVAVLGAGSVGAAATIALVAGYQFQLTGAEVYAQTLWTWIDVGGFSPTFTLYLDGLSLVMLGVITGVGFLIHLYATGYMAGEEGYHRFFAYMNLFVFAMLVLVLGDNLLTLYLGWEGVGLCSYLLIGFYHLDSENGKAARKAFVVTRVGDTAMALGMFLLFRELGTLEIQAVLEGAAATWPEGSNLLTLAALLLLGGAVGKSAQLPLQTWLPDAMAGPTPVSALIHAATMVTAGVYLIARMHDLFLLSPMAQLAVAIVGAATLFVSACSALTQTDIKRILAYSTMSQIGYMFLALGVGAWSAAVFHLMTHAFFKALLFLAAGSVILAVHHEQDIFKMGGLRRALPLPFASMVIGSAALSALPLMSGFFSKDAIVLATLDAPAGGIWFWVLASSASLLTAAYSMRLIFVTFFGDMQIEPQDNSRANQQVPLLLLSALAIGGGWFGLAVLDPVLPDGGLDSQQHEGIMVYVTALVPIAGIAVGYWLFSGKRENLARLTGSITSQRVAGFLKRGWDFDALYERIFVKPFVWLAELNKNDVVDTMYSLIAATARELHEVLSLTQTGGLRWYAAGMTVGLVVVITLALRLF